jgi:hypothetical protein
MVELKENMRTCSAYIGLAALVLSTLVAPVDASGAERITYAQAKERIAQRKLPAFWIGDVKGLAGRFENVSRGRVSVIAVTPGGRPVHLVAYGAKETVAHQANFNSAIGAREPSAYMDKTARKKPVVLFAGPVHGHEVEALTGLVNLIHVMETGRDLRGKEQHRLRELGGKCRLLIIPAGTLLGDRDEAIDRFIDGEVLSVTTDDEGNPVVVRDGNGVKDIKLFFQTYAYSGNKKK